MRRCNDTRFVTHWRDIASYFDINPDSIPQNLHYGHKPVDCAEEVMRRLRGLDVHLSAIDAILGRYPN